MRFSTLDEECCSRPAQTVIGEPVTFTERMARKREPDRVDCSERTDLRLPIGMTTTAAFQALEWRTNLPSNLKSSKDSPDP